VICVLSGDRRRLSDPALAVGSALGRLPAAVFVPLAD
jgi:hypothetical protein